MVLASLSLMIYHRVELFDLLFTNFIISYLLTISDSQCSQSKQRKDIAFFNPVHYFDRLFILIILQKILSQKYSLCQIFQVQSDEPTIALLFLFGVLSLQAA